MSSKKHGERRAGSILRFLMKRGIELAAFLPIREICTQHGGLCRLHTDGSRYSTSHADDTHFPSLKKEPTRAPLFFTGLLFQIITFPGNNVPYSSYGVF